MNSLVSLKTLLESESFVASVTFEWSILRVSHDVLLIVQVVEINSVTIATLVARNPWIGVDLFMAIEQRRSRETWQRMRKKKKKNTQNINIRCDSNAVCQNILLWQTMQV